MKKKNYIKMRFSTLLLCCLAILLCTASRGWAFSMKCTEDRVYVYYNGSMLYYDDEDGKYDVTEELIDTVRKDVDPEGELEVLEVVTGAIVNLDTSVTDSVQAHPGSILNIHSGTVGFYVLLSTGEPKPIVTVYGTEFAVDWDCDGTADPLGPSETEFTPSYNNSAVLEGTYQNGYPINLLFYSSVPIHLKALDDEVEIDIKPGSNTNSINLKSKGVVPVAVFTIAGGLDAGTIDPGTVLFAGASPVRWKLCDVDDDGDKDMLFHFKTQELVELDKDSTKATLTGTTFGGEDIELTDEVRIVPQKKKK